ncbi:hypothetical protein KQX54_017287 [Cotesia glomerata]|uniref:Uncharacterized protein n=1 Tax=Cotesia glomerata TaxID=32391 RepID=A0AAV7IAB0_COTGL|nr:hypothetical protein KQX54_017287 [Cotesia glomerata]
MIKRGRRQPRGTVIFRNSSDHVLQPNPVCSTRGHSERRVMFPGSESTAAQVIYPNQQSTIESGSGIEQSTPQQEDNQILSESKKTLLSQDIIPSDSDEILFYRIIARWLSDNNHPIPQPKDVYHVPSESDITLLQRSIAQRLSDYDKYVRPFICLREYSTLQLGGFYQYPSEEDKTLVCQVITRWLYNNNQFLRQNGSDSQQSGVDKGILLEQYIR